MSKLTLTHGTTALAADSAAQAVKRQAGVSNETMFIFNDRCRFKSGWVEFNEHGAKICMVGRGSPDVQVNRDELVGVPNIDHSLPLEANYLRAYARKCLGEVKDMVMALPNDGSVGHVGLYHIEI